MFQKIIINIIITNITYFNNIAYNFLHLVLDNFKDANFRIYIYFEISHKHLIIQITPNN